MAFKKMCWAILKRYTIEILKKKGKYQSFH